jgi:hypothetical protein
MYDFNKANKDDFGPIPPGIYHVRSKLKAGGAGDECLPRLAKNMRTQMLDIEHTVVGGVYSGRKLFELITVFAYLNNAPELVPVHEKQVKSYKRAVNMGFAMLRSLLESAHEIANDDNGEEVITPDMPDRPGLPPKRPPLSDQMNDETPY